MIIYLFIFLFFPASLLVCSFFFSHENEDVPNAGEKMGHNNKISNTVVFSVELLASDCLFEILGVEKNNLLSSFANRQGKLNFSQVISQRAMCFAQL